MNSHYSQRFTRLVLIGFIAANFIFNSHAQTVTGIVPDGKAHQFEARDHQFFIDGQPTMLVAGEMHFGRVQPEDWETRIKQAKAMGLNTISFYLFWNQVETREGKFNFTGMTDVRRVLKLCQKNGMWAVLRPGPYCCAEIEYGGIPWWTLKYPDVKVRTTDPQWLAWCSNYLAQVYKQVGDLQVSKGGPLLMVQVENEFGITDPVDNGYMTAMTKIFKDVGFGGLLFTCEPGTKIWSNPDLRVPGLMYGRNGLASDEKFQQSAPAIGDFPVYVPEVYTAWFSGWGEPIAKKNSTIPQITNWVSYLLDHNDSFCLFCLFGGSNYGFDNGCNFYLPVQASYNYSAPIDEAGRTTEKFRALRALLTTRLKINPPDAPAEPPVIEIPTIKLTQSEPLLQTLPRKPTLVSAKTISMEDLNQDYGFVLYRKTFPNGLRGKLELKTAQDYTVVMVNGKTAGTSFVGDGLDSNKIDLPETSGSATLDLLVYNLGRISVIVDAQTQHLARKGLIDGAMLDGADLNGWQIYSLPFDNVKNFKADAAPKTGPTFYRGTFTLDKLGGTFLDMRNWSMGAVWVNGHNLGRFWDHGGLRSLFLPSEWLKPGQNEIVVLELHDAPKLSEVSGGTKIIEEPAVPFAVKLDRADLKAPIAPAAEESNAPAQLLPLKIVGTKILDSNNQPVRLRGVNAASLEWTSDGEGHILQTVNVAIRDWHANIIRLPLSQDRWFGKAPEQTDGGKAYRELVHQVVDECATQNCYIILDLHWSDCNEWGANIGQHSMPDTNSIVFWKDFAPNYANNPAVLFDLYNEPHDVSWNVWLNGGMILDKPNQRGAVAKNYQCVGMQAMLDAVRSTGAKNVVICGGLDWAYDFSGILDGRQLSDPNGNGVIYSNHCYDNKGDSVNTWIAKMEKATAKLPVIVSEFGGNSGPSKKVPGDDWLRHVLQAIEDHQWSYTAWDLHRAAGPTLISDWNYTPSPRFGIFVKQALAGTLPTYTPPPAQ